MMVYPCSAGLGLILSKTNLLSVDVSKTAGSVANSVDSCSILPSAASYLGLNSNSVCPNTVKFQRFNIDGLFTMADLNLFSSPEKILLIAQENKY